MLLRDAFTILNKLAPIFMNERIEKEYLQEVEECSNLVALAISKAKTTVQ